MAIYRVQQCVFHQIEYNDMFFTLFAGELAWWYKDLTTHSTHTRGSHNGHPITAHQSHFHEKSVFRAVKSNTHKILFDRQKLSKNSATILFWMEEQGVANIFQTNKSGGKKHSILNCGWLVSLKNCRIVCISSTMSIISKVLLIDKWVFEFLLILPIYFFYFSINRVNVFCMRHIIYIERLTGM